MRRSLLAAALAVLLVLAGCSATLPAAPDDSAPSDPGSADLTVTVTRVVDGDTLKVEYANGTEDTVRLLGVDTPEVHAENTPDEFEGVPETDAGRECLGRWGERASAFAKDELTGETVGLTFDENEGMRGYYGRLLAYVSYDGGEFNYRLVSEGYARVYDSQFERRDRFYHAEAEAQQAGTGLWECATESPPTGTATGTATSTATPTGALGIRINADAAGNDNENLNDEYVVLTNREDEAVSLAGWTVEDDAGKTYEFGDVTLDPGASVTLHSGRGDDTASDVYWGRDSAVWNNGGDTVTVRDADGTVVAEKSY
ncbi:lamin tail domain-containing protein [Halorarius litoreus]|uniref:lamin tail domain-containing protein n=1 Tax=Halorarius litoreus TaxID=2962676 RepID=UPI0020CFBB7B|nr:lamin tail domain-containing protein [Halorarius litoreus]